MPATNNSVNIQEQTTFEMDVLKSKMWYYGDASMLSQFFKQINTDTASFWACVPNHTHEKIRKIHSGVPAMLADTLAYIVKSDLDKVEINKKPADEKAKWIMENFNELVGRAVVDTLVDGDGAFKISVDENISPYPIVEFIGGDRVDYEYSRGMLLAVIFRTNYTLENGRIFQLIERYEKDKITSTLYDNDGNVRPLSTIPRLKGIKPVVAFDGDYMMAVPLKFFENKKYKDRGKSIFAGGRSDCFDALDEVISQWWDAIRAGRVKQYIPEFLFPRDARDGGLRMPNQFGNNYIAINQPMQEGVTPKIEIVQPDIKYEAFVSSYTNALLMCLQGLVSPATLGIDVGKMSSADAQREKKDVTGNTRNTITGVLEKSLPKLVSAVLKTYDNMLSREVAEYDVMVSFGEYGAPDFDSRVETIGKASSYGVMSVETQVEELWGSSKDDDWKKSEVQRILSEKGLTDGEDNGKLL